MEERSVTETLFFGSASARVKLDTNKQPSNAEPGSLPPPMGRFKVWEEPAVSLKPKEFPSHQAICLDISMTREQSSTFRSQPYFVPVRPHPTPPIANQQNTRMMKEKDTGGISSQHIHVLR